MGVYQKYHGYISFDKATPYKDIDSQMIDKNTPQAAVRQLPKPLEKARGIVPLQVPLVSRTDIVDSDQLTAASPDSIPARSNAPGFDCSAG